MGRRGTAGLGHVLAGPSVLPVRRSCRSVDPDEGVSHYLHGVSPDGRRLAYARLAESGAPGRLAIMEPYGPTTLMDTGSGHIDGPEWSPDGAWIYLNTEAFTDVPGLAQLARVLEDGLVTATPRSSGCGERVRGLVPAPVPGRRLAPDSARFAFVAYPID
ncbi:MAG TPA: hypothetical protein VIT41_12050 [Microlunatus sp.]